MTAEMDDFWQKAAAVRERRRAATHAESRTSQSAAEAQYKIKRDRERVQRIGGRIVAAMVDRSIQQDTIYSRTKTDKNILGIHKFSSHDQQQANGWILQDPAAPGKPFPGTLLTPTNHLYLFNRLIRGPQANETDYYYFKSSWNSADLHGSLVPTDYQTHPEAGRLEGLLIGLALKHGLDSDPNITL